jgi:hypothetical protein
LKKAVLEILPKKVYPVLNQYPSLVASPVSAAVPVSKLPELKAVATPFIYILELVASCVSQTIAM